MKQAMLIESKEKEEPTMYSFNNLHTGQHSWFYLLIHGRDFCTEYLYVWAHDTWIHFVPLFDTLYQIFWHSQFQFSLSPLWSSGIRTESKVWSLRLIAMLVIMIAAATGNSGITFQLTQIWYNMYVCHYKIQSDFFLLTSKRVKCGLQTCFSKYPCLQLASYYKIS